MYVTLDEFRERFFGGSKHPSLSTLRRLADSGGIPTIRLGKRYFVDTVKFEADGNSVLEKVLRDVSSSS